MNFNLTSKFHRKISADSFFAIYHKRPYITCICALSAPFLTPIISGEKCLVRVYNLYQLLTCYMWMTNVWTKLKIWQEKCVMQWKTINECITEIFPGNQYFIIQYLVFYVVFCRSLFVILSFFLLAIVLSVLLQFRDSDYPFVSLNSSYQN